MTEIPAAAFGVRPLLSSSTKFRFCPYFAGLWEGLTRTVFIKPPSSFWYTMSAWQNGVPLHENLYKGGKGVIPEMLKHCCCQWPLNIFPSTSFYWRQPLSVLFPFHTTRNCVGELGFLLYTSGILYPLDGTTDWIHL